MQTPPLGMNAIAVADHLKASRGFYEHHGIYVGKLRVVHFTDVHGGKGDATIRVGTVADFAAGAAVMVVRYTECFSAPDVLERARICIGNSGYDLFQNNCEHFARWCKVGRHESLQVKNLRRAAGVAAGVFGAAYLWSALTSTETTASSVPRKQCKGTTAAGRRCRSRARSGNYGYCGLHR